MLGSGLLVFVLAARVNECWHVPRSASSNQSSVVCHWNGQSDVDVQEKHGHRCSSDPSSRDLASSLAASHWWASLSVADDLLPGRLTIIQQDYPVAA